MSKPIAVIISDVHYNLQTLELADAAMRLAIAKANQLQVPLIVAGDLHDTKANMRGECIEAMINTFCILKVSCFILRGNHDQINEKSNKHSLNFLDLIENVTVIDHFTQHIGLSFIPYQHDLEMFKFYLDQIDKGSTIIMHQGVKGSNAGDYMQDPTAIDKDLLADYRVISGHYHTRQDIKCGRPRKGAAGLMSFIGNPYTLNFGEANDPQKGFRILNEDGTLDFVPTNLRKHVVINITVAGHLGITHFEGVNPGDLVKVKATGIKEELSKISKDFIGNALGIHDFRLELIPLQSTSVLPEHTIVSSEHTLDGLIDNLQNTSIEQKERLKTLWKALCA